MPPRREREKITRPEQKRERERTRDNRRRRRRERKREKIEREKTITTRDSRDTQIKNQNILKQSQDLKEKI